MKKRTPLPPPSAALPNPDLYQKTRTRHHRGKKPATRITPRRTRPETPLLQWKFQDNHHNHNSHSVVSRNKSSSVPPPPLLPDNNDDAENRGKKSCASRSKAVVPASSARKLAASLWRQQLPDSGDVKRPSEDHLGGVVQPSLGHVGFPFLFHGNTQRKSEAKDVMQSPRSVSGSGPKNGSMCKAYNPLFQLEPSFPFSNSAMEGATKWDPVCLDTPKEISHLYGYRKSLDQQVTAVSVVSALEAELEQARARIQELETERKSSKKKLEHFLRKLSEEKALWRSRELEKNRAIVEDTKSALNHERKNRRRMEIVNSKLVNDLAEAKLSAKRFMQDYDKERKARQLIEEVCDELAKEIGEGKAEVETIKRDSLKMQEEVDEERKMLQMAEVWREERVQMKLIDAKVAIDEKYSQMNQLVAALEAFLNSRTATPDEKEIREAEMLRQAAASISIQEIKEFTYEPSDPNDIFSVFKDVNFDEMNEREIEACAAYSSASNASKIHTVSPEANTYRKGIPQRHSKGYEDEDGDIEDDRSGWETVSQLEDQGSSCSPFGYASSINKGHRDSNASGSGTEWEDKEGEETPITEIGEVVPVRSNKKGSSITRFWRSHPNNGENVDILLVDEMKGKISNGRKSNCSVNYLDHSSAKDGFSPTNLMGNWSSPDNRNPNINKGMKGCIEWPLSAQKNSLKAKLLEARIDTQKVQLRQVLKQKI